MPALLLIPKANHEGQSMPLFLLAHFQNWVISWAHTAIIPTNSVIDASAAASCTKTFNMAVS